MVETDNILDEILNYGPSADSISIVLTRMREEGRFSEVVQECDTNVVRHRKITLKSFDGTKNRRVGDGRRLVVECELGDTNREFG